MKTIRLWKLGYIDKTNPSNNIIPTKQAIDKLRELLNNAKNSNKNVEDIIWGPELHVELIKIDESDLDIISVPA